MTPQQQSALAAADACVVALTEAHRVLRASLADPVPPPVEPPPPPPVEPLPPATDAPPMTTLDLGSGARLLTQGGFHCMGDTYQRFTDYQVMAGTSAMVYLYRTTTVSGPRYLPERSYGLRIDGVAAGTFVMPAGQAWTRITVDPSKFAPGWLRVTVDGGADGEVCVPWWLYNDKGQAQPDLMPVAESSHKTPTDPTGRTHAMVWERPTYTPTPAPLVRREYPDVTAATKVHAKCVTRPERGVNLTVPSMTARGVVTAANVQSYFWYRQLDRWPTVPLLDGPRGVGTHGQTTHIEVGTGARFPGGPLMHNFYFSDPWRVSRGKEDGSSETLVGYRHKGMASYWGDGANQKTLELVGDWSAIPAERRGLWNVRSFCWDEKSLAVDESAAPIPSEENRLPHVVAPVMYITEQRESGKGVKADGRVLRVEFNARAHGVPPKVTELAAGLPGPWGIVDWGDRVIVALRNASRVIAIDKATGAQEVLLQGDATMAPVGQNGIPSLIGTRDVRRAQPVLTPECLKILDGHLYIGSFAAESVKRIDLATREIDQGYMTPVWMQRQSWFVEFALSDGTFGPRGTVFAQTWGQSDHASAYGTQPDGKAFKAHLGAAPWAMGTGYPCAVAVGLGRLYTASSNLGITRYGAATAGDLTINGTLYRQGEAEWDAMHGNLRWGSMGFGDHGHALPWGKSAAVDHYLMAHDAPKG